MKLERGSVREPQQAAETDNGGSSSSQQETSYERNFDGHLPLHWLQPKDQATKAIVLPSFKDLQLKTHRTLYGTTNSTIVPPRDKSPKGSVDGPIRHLVDLLNSHSRFCTLSSCSGRLSLFDPNGNTSNSHDGDEASATGNFTEESGKGRGSWVLVSHYKVDPEALVEAMAVNETESWLSQDSLLPWTFRFEPMLLHIAAASLEDGRKLLTIALNLGFRESGLVVTEKRVTVAIRSHSLSTVTPLFPQTQPAAPDAAAASLCVPPSYLRALVLDANQRLEANWKHLDKLYRSIESVLFEVRSSPAPIVVRNHYQTLQIPALNLWNAASIWPILNNQASSTQEEESSCKQEVCILGGYGCGPTASEKQASAKRSSKLYKLEREVSGGTWKAWKALESPLPSPNSTNHQQSNGEISDDSNFLQVPNIASETSSNSRLRVRWWKKGDFPDLQGMASCRWRESMYLFWGGRKSPKAPSDALFVFDTTSKESKIGTILDIRGDLPVARWGHQLLGLSGDRAVLLGGCNHQALDDIFVLHFCAQEDSNATADGYFCWERLSIRLPTPRFHFGATLLNGDTIVMVGGLESTRELLLPFESDDSDSACSTASVWAFKIGATQKDSGETTKMLQTDAIVVNVETPGSEKGIFESCFGMACCALLSKNLLLVTGGVQPNASRRDPIQAYWVSSNNSSALCMRRIGLDYDTFMDEKTPSFEFGSLVHHCCIPLADNELLLVGGGVPSFAFGESYASSHHLVIDTDNSSSRQQSDVENHRSKVSAPANLAKPRGPSTTSNGMNSDSGEAKEIASVLYVSPKHARQTKNSLQQKGWLEKRYRMIKVERSNEESDEKGDSDSSPLPKHMIAIPISVPFSEAIAVFGEFILHHGEEELPLSTSQYASKTKQAK